VDWIQLREKDLAGRAVAELTREALRAVAGTTAHLIVNDRLDVALAAGAGGVHLGESGLPAGAVNAWLKKHSAAGPGAGFLCGVSCHSLEGALAAEAAGASYIFFGPVFATPSKAKLGAPQGLPRLAEVCKQVRMPVLAIGGITLANARDCFRAGVAGLAAIRMFQNARDLPALVAGLRAAAAAS
jgi:thiamine-phosphate pyrophosphorylase